MRGIQYAAASRFDLAAVEYWLAQSSCGKTRFAPLPGYDG
jgi:hypothetical protein